MDLDKLCEYMADTYPNAKQVRSTLLFGQVYTKKFKQKVEESLGGKTVVGNSWYHPGFFTAMVGLSTELNWSEVFYRIFF